MINMEQTRDEDIVKTCPPEACDTFQFMVKKLGLSVLHPGGPDATRKLTEISGIQNGLEITNLGCGRGSTPRRGAPPTTRTHSTGVLRCKDSHSDNPTQGITHKALNRGEGGSYI